MQPHTDINTNASAWLTEVIATKKRRNPAYSLRALARQLGVSAAYLSQVINGKKNLSPATIIKLATLLDLSDKEVERLLTRVALEGAQIKFTKGNTRTKSAKAKKSVPFENFTLDRFRLLSDWYHLALLDLLTVEGASSKPSWLAKTLGISVHEVRSALTRLERLGFLERHNDQLKKSHVRISFPTDKTDASVRRFHNQMIARALEALERQGTDEFESRDISAITMAINPVHLDEAKRRIRKFRKELFALLSEGACTELYQFNSQLFRLTPKPLSKNSKNGAKP